VAITDCTLAWITRNEYKEILKNIEEIKLNRRLDILALSLQGYKEKPNTHHSQSVDSTVATAGSTGDSGIRSLLVYIFLHLNIYIYMFEII
jgi:hypothetical protein